MAEVIYVLCALTSIACAALLIRFYVKTRVRLLMWSSVCFVGFVINNVALFLDMVVCTELDLSLVRTVPAVFGMVALVVALAWETP